MEPAIGELKLADLGNAKLSDSPVVLTRHLASLEAARLEMLRNFDAPGFHMAGGRTAEQVRLARALVDMPITSAAFIDGDVGYGILVAPYRGPFGVPGPNERNRNRCLPPPTLLRRADGDISEQICTNIAARWPKNRRELRPINS